MPQGIQLFNFKYKSMEKNSHESFSDGIFRLKKVKGKVSWLMLFLGVCLLPGNVFAQEQKVTLDFVDAKVSDVFDEINRQTGLGFVYNRTQLQEINPVTLQVKNVTVDAAMSRLLEGTSFEHYFEMGSIVVRRREQPAQQVEERKVAGVVKDEAGNPLPGVAILLKGTTIGVATDIDGKYSLQLPSSQSITLVFSFVGMKTQEIAYTGQPELNVVMVAEASELEDVVITGYQTIVREKVTGSTSTVTSRQLEERYTPNILDNLEGRVAGLVTYGDKTIIRGTSSLYAETNPLLVVDGLPIEGNIEDLNPYDIESVTVLKDAAAAAIYGARASNGVIVVTTKKATKEGKTEIQFSGNLTIYEKRNMDYHDNFYMNAEEQVETESAYWDYYFFRNRDIVDPISTFETDLLNYGYISQIQYLYYQYATNKITKAELEQQKEELSKNDFAKEYGEHALRRQFLQQYNLAIRNRTEKFNSNLILNYRRNNNGIIQSYDSQLNIAYRGSYDMKNWLAINFGITGILSKQKESASTYATDPFNTPAYSRLLNEDGSYNYYSTNVFNQYYTKDDEEPSLKTMNFNHLEELYYDHIFTDRRNMRYQGELVFKVIEGLNLNTSFVYETERQNISNYSEADSYAMRYLRNYMTVGSGEYLIPENGGKLTTEDTRGEYWTARAQLNFSRTFRKHAVDFLGGFEFRETRNKGTRSLLLGYDDMLQSHSTLTVDFPYIRNLYTPNTYFANVYSSTAYYEYISNAVGIVPEEHHRYASGYMNLTYTYDKRYNLFASFRKDYADLFGTNAKFRGKPLWSVGASWNIGQESFMPESDWLNMLKLRVSYGKTGNIYQGTTSYMTASTGTTNRYTNQPVANVESPANPNLKWEKTATINVGIDFSLFEHRLRGTIDWYNKKGSDIFSHKTLETTTGFSSMNMNMASLRNNGIEITLSGDCFSPEKDGDFAWTASLTASYNKNKITAMEVPTLYARQMVDGGFQVGYPTSALFSYHYAGLDQEGNGENHDELGQPMYWTADGRKVYGMDIQMENSDCLVYSGQSDPKVTLAMDHTFRYKGFSLNFMAVYYGGHKMRCQQYEPMDGLRVNAPLADYYVNSWTPENTDTDVPGIGEYCYTSTTTSTYLYTDIFVQPADFIKIRNITLGYDVPQNLIRTVGLNNLQVRFQVDNLPALWKKNNLGVDPETLGIREQMMYVIGLNFSF